MDKNILREKLRGVIVIFLTPFNVDFSLDEDGIRSNIQFLIEKGIKSGIVVGGSLGECYAMRTNERKRLFEIAIEEANGRVPILCGINESATLIAVELAQYAESVGADGVMLLPPYYMAPNEESILLHFRMVGDAIDIGIMVYNNQWVSKVDMSLELLEKLAEFENVVAVKDCTPDFFRFRQAIDHLGGRLNILNCMAEFWEPQAFAAGSQGFLSAMANFAPEISLQVAEAGAAGDIVRGKELYQNNLHPYLEVEALVAQDLGDAETVALYKAAMNIRGLASGPVRPPLHPLPEKYIPQLKAALEKIGVN